MISNFGLLLARSAVGLDLASHGLQKRLGWFNGPGPEAAARLFEELGFSPGRESVRSATALELAGGVLMTLGLGGPLGPACATAVMTVAILVQSENGFFNADDGLEFPLLYALAALTFGSSGYGKYSFDRLLGLDRHLARPALLWPALAAGVGAGIYAYVNRDRGDS